MKQSRARSRAAALAATLGLAACGGTAPPEPQMPAANAFVSPPLAPVAPLAPLLLPEAAPKPDAETTVPVLFAVDRAFVNETVERLVPQRLHEEKGRDLGNGTKLDLVVTRRQPKYAVKGSALSLELPLELSIDVKSRLGPIELNLGHCQPDLLARLSLPTRFATDLSLPDPELKLELQQPCRLSGFDVSELLTRELQKQQLRAERELREGFNRARPIITDQARGLQEVLDARDPRCPHLVVRQLVQSPLQEHHELMTTSLSVRGQMAYSCEPPPTAPLAVEQRSHRLPFDLAEPLFVDWSTLSRALDPILSQHGLTARPLQLRSAITPAGERIALGISGEKTTGWVFLTAQLQNGTLRLFARESDNAALLQQLSALVVGVTLPIDVKPTEQRAQRLLKKANRLSQVHLSRAELTPQLTLQPEQLRTEVDAQVVPEGVALTIHVREPASKP